jgi:hypothetical protein
MGDLQGVHKRKQHKMMIFTFYQVDYMKKKSDNISLSLRFRISRWWSNFRKNRIKNAQKEDEYKKGKEKTRLSKGGVGAQVENMRPRK